MERRLALVRGIAPVLLGMVLLLVAMGGFVTASQSGLGCGTEWPVCLHQFVPPAGDFHAWVEWLHRLLAGLVTVGVLAVAAILRRREATGETRRMRLLRHLSLAAVGLIVVEVLLGMATVLLALPAWIIAIHMADAVAIVDVTAAIVWTSRRRGPVSATTAAQPLLWWAAGLAALTAAIGSYVTHSGSGIACVDGPACLGRIGAPGGTAVLVFGAHVLAVVSVALVVVAAWRAARAVAPRLYGVAAAALAVQATIGILLLWSHLLPALLEVHEFVGISTAALLWLAAWAVNVTGTGPAAA